MENRRHRGGFTLIEVLAVIAIIGILAALLISAVQRAREAARRLQCANTMKNLGLALHNHVDARGTFPAGSGRFAGESYLVSLLPFLEQQSWYDSFNFAVPPVNTVFCTENSTSFLRDISIFFCPSDSYRLDSTTHFSSKFSANYAANCGNHFVSGDGAFIGKPLRPAEFADGLSRTVGLSEWIISPGDDDRPTRLGPIYILDNRFTSLAEFSAACYALDPSSAKPNLPAYKGQFWADGAATQYNHILPPNMPSCSNRNFKARSAGSNHGDGANVLTLDGGVHYVKSAIDPRVWAAMSTRARGDLISGDAAGW